VTVGDRSHLVTELSVVARIDGPGLSDVKNLVEPATSAEMVSGFCSADTCLARLVLKILTATDRVTAVCRGIERALAV
jgi:hypothetical protein